MRKFWQILCVCLCALVIPACGSDEDDPLPVDEEWRLLNDEAFQKQTQVEGYERLESQSNAGYILYKVLETGDSDEPIYFTSQVECYYKGTFVDGTVFTDMSFEYGAPATINVNEMIDGFATALQYMHPGDRWEIWIPQALGYGSAGSASRQQSDGTYSTEIKPYTTLIYELEVTRVIEP